MLPNEETYGEHFDIPQPDETVFISWFSGGGTVAAGDGPGDRDPGQKHLVP